MSRVLVIEPEQYEGLTEEMEEVGLEYDVATREEASELFSRIGYDAVVGPEDDILYQDAISDETPFLVYNSIGSSSNGTDRLIGESGFDAKRVAGYAGHDCFETYTNDPDTVFESHDDIELFLDMVEHDVKNDVYIAESYFDLLDVEGGQEEKVEIIAKRFECINSMMEDLGTLRALENDGQEDLWLNGVLFDIKNSYNTMASENGFELNFDANEDVKASGGPLLEDMYSQIVENSIRHSKGSEIQITLEDDENPLVIIEDDGRGIPDNIIEDIFEAGVKGNETGNTGMGTALIDRIAGKYDIDIEVGESDMGGAKFRLEHQPAEKC